MAQSIKRTKGLTAIVEEALREVTAQYRPGDQLPTERALADQFKVSIVKVREALTLLAREGLVERVHGRGTYVCEPPVRQWTAVVLVHNLAHPTLSFHERSVFQSVRRQLTAAGVPCRGYAAFGNPATYDRLDCVEFFQDLEAGRIRHVIPVGGDLSLDVIAELTRFGIGRTCPSGRITEARRREIVQAGTRYLIAQGRSRLAMLAWSDPRSAARAPAGDAGSLESLFREELRSAGLSYHSEWVKSDLHPNLAGAGWQEFRDLWCSGSDKPDGLLICNDLLARDAAIAIAESGIRVPDTLLVVTHENRGSGQWFPFPVARLQVDPDQDAAVMAHEAMGVLGVRTGQGGEPAKPTCSLIPLGAHAPDVPRAAVAMRANAAG